jgi:hypothetical protein
MRAARSRLWVAMSALRPVAFLITWPAFVFDLVEPERPKVDRAVLAFLKSEALHPVDFTIRQDGVVRLNPELARRVAGLANNGVKERVF